MSPRLSFPETRMTALLLRGFPPQGKAVLVGATPEVVPCSWMCGALRKASWVSLLSFLGRQTLSPFTLGDLWQSVAEPLPRARLGVALGRQKQAPCLFSHSHKFRTCALTPSYLLCGSGNGLLCPHPSSSATAPEIA